MSIKINLNPTIPPIPNITDKTKINIRYVLISPYVSVHIYWDKKIGEVIYEIEEPKLDNNEKSLLETLEKSLEEMINVNLLVQKTAESKIEYIDKICPKCQGRMVVKWSRRGRFLSCENFPKCRYAESITSGVACPGCKEGQLIERRNRRGQNFYGCSKFPKCTYTSRHLPDNNENNDKDSNEG